MLDTAQDTQRSGSQEPGRRRVPLVRTGEAEQVADVSDDQRGPGAGHGPPDRGHWGRGHAQAQGRGAGQGEAEGAWGGASHELQTGAYGGSETVPVVFYS